MNEPVITGNSGSTAYQDGNVILDISVTKMANGQYKASALGREFSAFNSDTAVQRLQSTLESALKSGEIQPEM